MSTITGQLNEILIELERAEAKFPAFHSAHEGYAVLLEEVKKPPRETENQRAQDNQIMRKEAVQVAAMALRFIRDVCDK